MEPTTTLETSVTSYNLGPVQRIPLGEGRVFRVDETSIAIFRTREGQVFATQALCPHRAGPLADGLIGSGKVVCPLHSYVFELATGQPVDNACAYLQTYPTIVNANDEIVLNLHR